MKTLLIFFSFLFLSLRFEAQNLLPNSGFEAVTNGYCTGGGGGYYQLADGWYNAANSANGNSSSDHICNTFYSVLFNTPQTGSGSMGFASGATPSAFNGRFSEAVTTTLTNSVTSGSVVNFTISVNPVNKPSTITSSYVVNDPNIQFGLYFYSSGAVPESTVGIQHLTAVPHHTIPTTSFVLNTWVTYTASFIVPVNATKVAIGFFNPSSVTTFSVRYFNIDNVSMVLANPCITSPATAGASSGGVVTCSNPNVTLTGTGGGTYSWSGPGIVSGATTANPLVNAGGTYNVLVTAANGCTATTNVVVSQNTTPPTPSASSAGPITCSSPNVTLSGSGGGSYSWSGPGIVSGATTANPVVNAGGTYNLTVTGSNGCTANTSVNVTTNTTPPSPSASAPGPITCSSPNVTLSGSGGGSYSWSGPSIVSGATTANPVVNAGGTYNLTVTGSNGCTANTSVNVTTDNAAPSPSASSPGPITCSSPNVTLSGSGGGSYSWSGPSIVSGATTANPVVNAGGTYNLTVTGSNGCNANTSVNVTTNTTPPSPGASAPGPITCSSPNVTLTGSGGGSYSWSGPGIVSGATTANPVVNAGGTYNLTVTGSNGCTANTSVNVTTNTTPPSPGASAPGPITCASPNVTLSGSGGGSYSWSGPGIVSGATTANPVVNAGGTYNLTVTGSNGCTANTSVNVTTDNAAPSPSASSPGPITCSSPNVTLSGSGGGSYSWSGPGIVSGATTANPLVNAGGTYNLTVTGSNGCTANTSVNVTTNTTPPSPGASSPGPITCSSPNITLSGSGGGSYSWSGPGIVSGATTANPVVNAGGTYNLTVTGSNGCTANTNVVVSQNTTPPSVSTSPTTTNLNCTTPSTSLNGLASGGTSPYSYSWSSSTGLSATNVANPTANPSSTITYTLIVTDDNGCTGTSNVTINVNKTPPSVTTSAGSVKTCSNPNVTLTATGGGSYAWTGTGIVSGASSANPVVNQAGIFNVAVTGANGCITNSAVTVSQNTTTPSISLSTASSLSTTCANPTATLSATSNANPTTVYSWLTPSSTTLTGNPITVSAPGIYSVLVTNTVNGCNSSTTPTTVQVVADSNIPNVTLSANTGTITCLTTAITMTANTTASPVTYNWLPSTGIQSGANTATPTFTAGGNYSLTVTNTANSCVSAGAGNVVTITQNNTNPTAAASSTNPTLDCNNTTITLTGTGGGNYIWTGPGIVSGATTANPIVNQAGTYSLIVTNPSNNCSSNNTATLSITQNTTSPSAAITGANTLSTTCANPTATLTASSTSDPSTTYQWLTPSSTTLTGNPVTANTAGVYTVIVTNTGNGCKSSALASANNTVQIVPDSNIPNVTLSSNAGTITCSTLNVSVTASVNVSTVTYNWLPTSGIQSGANTANPTFTAGGSYSLTVTNTANSCVSGGSGNVVNVTQNNTNPTAGASSGVTVLDCNNSSITLTGTGGGNYNWSGPGIVSGATTANPVVNQTGTYSLVVTDPNNNCNSTNSAVVTITQNTTVPSITSSSTGTINTTCANPTATLTATSSSDPNTTYNWLTPISTTLTGNPVTTSVAGIYTLVIIDNNNGCSSSPLASSNNTVEIVPDSNIPTATLSANNAQITCSDPTPNVMANSSTSNLSYNWTPTAGILSGANTNNPTFDAPGSYSLVMTNTVNSCVSNPSDYVVTVTTNTNAPVIGLLSITPSGTLCNGESATITPTGALAGTYTLVNNPTSSEPFVVTPTATTVYTITGTGANGCVSSAGSELQTTITVNQTPTISLLSVFPSQTVCVGQTATISVSGATTFTLVNNNSTNSPFLVTPNIPTTYTIIGTDINGCKNNPMNALTVTMDIGNNLLVSTINQSVTCHGGNNGIITASVSSPNPYSYQWSNGSTTGSINNLTAGDYTLTVTDIYNCVTTQTTTISEPLILSISELINKASCDNSPTGEISINVTGGTPSYTVIWNNGVIGNQTSSLSAGTVTAIITDANGCVESYTTDIASVQCLDLNIPTLITPNGDGLNEPFIIKGIEFFPNNKLEIYNRWGNLIYTKAPYDNTFNGKANVSGAMGNGLLPSGTYFVVFDFGDGKTEAYKGYLEVKY